MKTTETTSKIIKCTNALLDVSRMSYSIAHTMIYSNLQGTSKLRKYVKNFLENTILAHSLNFFKGKVERI